MTKPMTDKQFSDKIGAIKRSGASLRQNVQEIICDGIAKYGECGDTSRLSRIRQAIVGVACLPTGKIEGFIKHHANVMLATSTSKKTGKKLPVFRKDKNKEDRAEVPTENWWEWKDPSKGEKEPVVDAQEGEDADDGADDDRDMKATGRTGKDNMIVSKEGHHHVLTDDEYAELLVALDKIRKGNPQKPRAVVNG